MRNTSGSTKAVEVMMDAQAVLHRMENAHAGLVRMVGLIWGAVNEPNAALAEAEAELREAVLLYSRTDKDAHIQRARRRIAAVLDERMADESIDQLYGALRSHHRSIEAVSEEMAALVAAAAGCRCRRTNEGPGWFRCLAGWLGWSA